MKSLWMQLIWMVIGLASLGYGMYWLWGKNTPNAALYIAFSALFYGYYLNAKTDK